MNKKQVWTVYTVTDEDSGEIVYVGETRDYRKRVYMHTRERLPIHKKTGGIGKFHKKNVLFLIVAVYDNWQEAFDHQCNLQTELGMKTDIQANNLRKLDLQKAMEIRKMYFIKCMSKKSIAEHFGVSRRTVFNIINNVTYKQ